MSLYPVGTQFKSTQERDWGRTVEVIGVVTSAYGDERYRVRNVKTGKLTELSRGTIRKNWAKVRPIKQVTPPNQSSLAKPAVAAPATRPATQAKRLTTDRERELLRIIKKCFSNYNQRGQHYYLGGGMSTSHIVLKVLEDVDQIHAFWPPEHTKRNVWSGVSYVLADDVFKKVQNRIRETLNALATKGHLEKIGNTDERRWKPTYAEAA